MEFSNERWVKNLRILFLACGLVWFLAISVLLFLEQFGLSVLLGGLFLIAILGIAILNLQYVSITVEKNRVIVRYYSIFSVDRLFQMFEFPVEMLRKVEVRNYFLGLKWEVRFSVRVRMGLADYPWVSLSAVPFRERSGLLDTLKNLIPQKSAK